MPELTQHEIITSKIAELQTSILTAHPQMPLLLREIHKQLKEDPTIVTLLKEEQIKVVINGLEKQTQTYLSQINCQYQY